MLLIVHVCLALGLMLPSLLLPFALRARRPASASGSPIVRGLLVLQARGAIVFGLGVAVTGGALVAVIGEELLREPWLLAALVLYSANLALAFFLQRPSLRRLVVVRAGSYDHEWQDRARRMRYASYLMAALVGVIAFLMSAKPRLW